jgi:hypothetical protein
MIGLINTSFTITVNHNKFTKAHNKSSAETLTLSILVLLLRCTPLYSVVLLQQLASQLDSLIIPRHGPHGKHFSSVVLEWVFIGPLPSIGLFAKNLSPRQGVYWPVT